MAGVQRLGYYAPGWCKHESLEVNCIESCQFGHAYRLVTNHVGDSRGSLYPGGGCYALRCFRAELDDLGIAGQRQSTAEGF